MGWFSTTENMNTLTDQKPILSSPPQMSLDVFDPRALERGAKALREISGNRDRSQAWSLLQAQEQAKHAEALKDMKKEESLQEKFRLESKRVEETEKRKTLSHQELERRKTIQERQLSELVLHQRKLDIDAADREQRRKDTLKAQKEEHRQNTALTHERAKNQLKIEKELVDYKITKELEQKRAGHDLTLAEMKARSTIDNAARAERLSYVVGTVSTGLKHLITSPKLIRNTVLITTLCTLGLYGAKEGTALASDLIKYQYKSPALVRDTSVKTISQIFKRKTKGAYMHERSLPKLVVPPDLNTRLTWMENGIKAKKQDQDAPLGHCILYGPPGTGKTLFCKSLAKRAGLDYAFVSGGDILPLKEAGSAQLHDVFRWARLKSRRRGLLLIIDEADSCLGHRSIAEPYHHSFISTFLSLTGSMQSDVMVMMTTNEYNLMDKAVVDRTGDSIYFDVPTFDERVQLLYQYRDRLLVNHGANRARDLLKAMTMPLVRPSMHKHKKGYSLSSELSTPESEGDSYWSSKIAPQLEGWSGRQIMQLFLEIDRAAKGSGTTTVNAKFVEVVLKWKLDAGSLKPQSTNKLPKEDASSRNPLRN